MLPEIKSLLVGGKSNILLDTIVLRDVGSIPANAVIFQFLKNFLIFQFFIPIFFVPFFTFSQFCSVFIENKKQTPEWS